MARKPSLAKTFTGYLDKAKSVGGMITRAASYFASQFSPDDRVVFQKKFRADGQTLSTRNSNPVQFIAQTDSKNRFTQLRQSIHVGGLYVYKYDPKYKDSLPYWDMFPLLFLIGETSEHFIGLNLHYIAPRQRAQLMDAIRNTLIHAGLDPKDMDDEKKSGTRKARSVSYQQLMGASRHALFKPCVKKYLKSHVKSQFAKVPYKDWQEVLFLPLQRFQKENSNRVWRDSTRRN